MAGHAAKPKAKRELDALSKAVVKVGTGRGFIVQYRREFPPFKGKRTFGDQRAVVTAANCLPHFPRAYAAHHWYVERAVVTAAHCLPRFPPSYEASHTYECTYKNLLGSLDAPSQNVWAECLFVDPIADIAILDGPNSQEHSEESYAYAALVENAPALPISRSRRKCRVWLLGLDGKWCPVSMENPFGRGIWIDAPPKNKVSISGSPILSDEGTVIGLVSVGMETIKSSETRVPENLGPQPVLAHHLPVWFLRDAERERIKRSNEFKNTHAAHLFLHRHDSR